MTVKIAPPPRQQFLDTNGDPYSGAKLFTYTAGTTTKENTYTTSAGTVANTNPIILDSAGRTPSGLWLTAGVIYKFVLAPSDDTDPPASPIFTEDNVSGTNDTATISGSQWAASAMTPTYVSSTSFTVAGDQTTTLDVGRRIQATVSGGTVYGHISASAYTSLTTVTMVMDAGDALDAGLSSFNVGILSGTSQLVPRLVDAKWIASGLAVVGSANAFTGDDTHAGDETYTGILDFTGATITGATPLVFEGATADDFETSIAITDPTADRTITVPDADVDLTKVRTATASLDGVVELATEAEVQTGTDTARVPSVSTFRTGKLVLGTMVDASSGSPTEIDFTSIPSWVKRITVMWDQVSTNGTSGFMIQIGDSGGVETTAYRGSTLLAASGSGTAIDTHTNGFVFQCTALATGASTVRNGQLIFTLMDSSTNLWSAQGIDGQSHAATIITYGGTKALSGTLDRVRITTENGTDTFDAGDVNIMYE